jgi:uncharacterized protein YsxB (DUF464 family)
MIHIKISKQTWITSYHASGHALFADYGNDIVCASVSTLSILASNLVEQWSKVQTDIKSGYLELNIKEPNEATEKVMQVIITALKDLIKQYPKHITLDIKEE